jgi:hypothetical protein
MVDVIVLPEALPLFNRSAAVTNASDADTTNNYGLVHEWVYEPSAGVFRDSNGAIQLQREGSPVLYSGGGVFAGDPTMGRLGSHSVVVARDTYNSLWANVFRANTRTWESWTFGGGLVQGTPAVAVVGGTAYIAARDLWNSYWITSYTPGVGFGPWTYLAGVFSTDPVMCAAPDGSLYVIGKDNWNSLWSGRYVPVTGFTSWVWGMGIVKGKPSVACLGPAYVAVRDNWDSLWLARVSGDTWTWNYGGGIMSADPQAAAGPYSVDIPIVVRDPWAVIWYRNYNAVIQSWFGWQSTGGILEDFAPAMVRGELNIAGRDAGNGLWWYRTGTGWSSAGSSLSYTPGALSAGPR